MLIWTANPFTMAKKLSGIGERQYIADHCCFLVESIIKCYEDRYWFDDDVENADGTTNDHLVFHICKSLNSTAWPQLPQNDESDEEILKIQVNSISQIFDQFSDMKIFMGVERCHRSIRGDSSILPTIF